MTSGELPRLAVGQRQSVELTSFIDALDFQGAPVGLF